jgi:hypothetical protein
MAGLFYSFLYNKGKTRAGSFLEERTDLKIDETEDYQKPSDDNPE